MEEDLKELASSFHYTGIQEVVVGLPRNNGWWSLGQQAEKVLEWNKSFKRMAVPVKPGMNGLSTVEPRVPSMRSLETKTEGTVDKVAAVLILQGYLDRTGKQNDGDFSPGIKVPLPSSFVLLGIRVFSLFTSFSSRPLRAHLPRRWFLSRGERHSRASQPSSKRKESAGTDMPSPSWQRSFRAKGDVKRRGSNHHTMHPVDVLARSPGDR